MKIAIRVVLALVAVVLAYLIYDGIQNKIEFQKIAEKRRSVVIDRLVEIREAQKGFKKAKGRYANNFPELIHFIESDSIPIVKAIGTVPDSLTVNKAVELGIVTRDTTMVPAKEDIFDSNFIADSLQYVPFSGGEKFEMKSDIIEKNKVNVAVFMASAPFRSVYKGLDTRNENIDLEEKLTVGSLTEPTLNGNWE